MPILSKLNLPVLVDGEVQMIEYTLPSGGGAGSPESLGIGYGVCNTAYSTTAKTATLEDYVLRTNGIVAIKFANAVNANATLNINGEGAKPIYYGGKAIINGIIKARDTATLIYDGTNYHVLQTDSPWRAEVRITGDPDAVIHATNSAFDVNDYVALDEDGHGSYICKAPGTYVFSTE